MALAIPAGAPPIYGDDMDAGGRPLAINLLKTVRMLDSTYWATLWVLLPMGNIKMNPFSVP
jgi:hypothetical protein